MLMVLIVSCVVFVFGHLLLSHIPVREALIKRLTFGGFMGFYSLMALGSMLGMIIGYRYTPTTYVWSPVMWTRWLPLVGMPLVTYLFLAGFTAKNPTSAGQEGALAQEDLVTGVLKITRHPGLWGFALWGLIHIPGQSHVWRFEINGLGQRG